MRRIVGAMSSSASFKPLTTSSNTGAAAAAPGARLKLPFVVAVLASCSYIIAADQKSREVGVGFALPSGLTTDFNPI